MALHILYSSPRALAQMVACLPLVQQIRGSIPGGVVNFHLKIFNLGARRGGGNNSIYVCNISQANVLNLDIFLRI